MSSINNISTKKKEECCGCGLCAKVCAAQAITMQPDSLGFRYPVVDNEKCTNCGYCAMLCPMGAIDPENCSLVPGKCVRCCACVKLCRPKAKYFADETYLEHKAILEEKFTEPRKEPQIFW